MAEAQTYTLAEWRAEAERRGNGDMVDCPFLCPLCGAIATPRDFKAAGAQSPDEAAQMCIGNLIGAQGNLHSTRPVPQPCDWKAHGLFGTLDGGCFIELPSGEKVNVFSFADI